MTSARILLSLKAAVVRIVKLDNESVDRFALPLYAYQDSTTSIGEAVNCVDVVDEDDLCVDLQLQFCLKRCILDAPGIIDTEGLHCSAGVFCFEVEQLSSLALFLALTLALVP